MIYFFADNHYGVFPGKTIYEALPAVLREQITFTSDDWTLLESGIWEKDCSLLILNMIGATCNQPHPGAGAGAAVKRYCERGGNLLLLHGSSAAFWQWQWWRRIVGLRWVRPGDPDGGIPSTHPKEPYTINVFKTLHPLAKQLRSFSLETDEIYTELEQTCPVDILMTTTISNGSHIQAYETHTPWGGKVIGFLPGHDPKSTSSPDYLYNFEVMLNYLK